MWILATVTASAGEPKRLSRLGFSRLFTGRRIGKIFFGSGLGSGLFNGFFRQLFLQRLDAGGENHVFLAGLYRHLTDGFEVFTLDEVHRMEKTLGLAAEYGLKLATHALGGTGRVGYHLGELIENSVCAVRHRVVS